MSSQDETWLSFSITPVQGFIEAARTVRDLAVGSLILSTMVDAAIKAGEAGVEHTLFPASGRSGDSLSLPNRFVMRFDSCAQAKCAATAAQAAALDTWLTLAREAKQILAPKWSSDDWNPEDNWQKQVENYWDIQIRLVAHSEVTEPAFVRVYGIPEPDPFRRQWGLLAAAADSAKQVRNYPGDNGAGRQKCSLLGEFEQMGPKGRPATLNAWWTNQVGVHKGVARIGERDRLCAVSLVKRFAPVTHSASDLLQKRARSVDDTATIATARWRTVARKKLSREWAEFEAACASFNRVVDHTGSGESVARLLLEDNLTVKRYRSEYPDLDEADVEKELAIVKASRTALLTAAKGAVICVSDLMPIADEMVRDIELKLGAPPRYLAAIALDGDRMGQRLARLTNADEFASLGSQLKTFADETRPIVNRHLGEHIYAGGDDLLALVGVGDSLACVADLQAAFPKELPGGTTPTDISTVSVGIALFHYKYDLRDALHKTRAAEKLAKTDGRNRVGLSILKRSGGDIDVTATYGDLALIQRLGGLFRAYGGFGWMAGLHELEPALREASRPQVRAQVRFFTGHSDKLEIAASEVVDKLLEGAALKAGGYGESAKKPFDRFIKFIGAAAFMARGRE